MIIDVRTHRNHARLFESVNKRGCLFALDLVSDLLKHGYQPDGKAKETFDELFQEYDGNTFAEKVDAVLQEHRFELMELCADFSRMITDIPGGMETTLVVPEVVEGGMNQKFMFPHFDLRLFLAPRPELRGEAGFSSYFCPEDRNWLTYVLKDKYSVLPDSLRISCRRMDKHSESDLIGYTRNFLFSDGHITTIVWHLRRLAIHVRGFSLENEVGVLAILGETTSIDNYLFWHHRRWVSEKTGSYAAANNELEFTAKILSDFPYNHYAWSHRQWVREVFGKDWGKAELDYCNKILKEDASNCFLWNQRYFVFQKHPKWYETRGNEVKYAIAGHIKEDKVDIRDDAYVKKRVVYALMMILFALKQNDFKPNQDLKTNINYLCPPEAAEESFAEKVVSIYWRFMNKRINTGTKRCN
ncbi:hypothetical protein CASFOL_041180 [Castilleja foliolosa]|uniref:Protein farnesyltransferase/geranylgeranyltransferase type-1 subunit alpha n=1 Tax=Castilleja foliolosa TaxID=1961234 RepID=A0ABD3BE27_9LAMI